MSQFYPTPEETIARRNAELAREVADMRQADALDRNEAAARNAPAQLSPERMHEQDARLAEYEELNRTNPFRSAYHIDRFGSSIFAARARRDAKGSV